MVHALAFALYLAAAASFGASLANGRRGVTATGIAMTGAAVLVHGVALVVYGATYGEMPLVGLAPSLSTLAFLIAVLQLGAALFREARPLGLVLVPISALLVGIALALGVAPAGEPLAFQGVWFALHVVLALIGYAGLAVAFAAGLMYLLQFRTLKDKQFGRMFRFFPSLEATDRLGRRALLIGFPALTLGILIGVAWIARFGDPGSGRAAEVIWGVLTWFVFVGAFFARSRRLGGDRGGAVASVVGFVLVVVAFVVLRLAMAEGRWFL